jgi:hypothetical protein
MAKFLCVIFLISISYKLLAEFTVVSRDNSYVQTAQKSNDAKNQEKITEKGEKEFNVKFQVLQLNYQNLSEATLETKLKHGEPFPGFTNSNFTPPDII